MSATARRRSSLLLALAALCALCATISAFTSTAQAIPAFARKYNLNCQACHTAPPVLNQYGQRFLENGYQLPGTEDGGIVGKRTLGDLTLDDVGHYLGFRMVGNVARNWRFAQQNPPGTDTGVVENKTEFTFPENFVLFTGGAVAKNIGYMVELGHDTEGGGASVERGFLTFNNLGGHDLAHLRVGRFDPNTFSSYATVRQQLSDVGESASSSCPPFTPCRLNRPALGPAAFAAKFYGLYDRTGTAISPHAASLYNSGGEMGIDIHGRPFGDWFLYQVGVLNGAQEGFGDTNKGKDFYGMIRFDYARAHDLSANISGFYYHGNSNAKVASQEDVQWNRMGVSARLTYRMVDLYAAYAYDRIHKIPTGLVNLFDRTATGLTVGLDTFVTDHTLLSFRYDHMDAGGLIDTRQSTRFVGLQAKHFLRSNIAVYARNDVNLRSAEGGDQAARNLRNAFFTGIDVVF